MITLLDELEHIVDIIVEPMYLGHKSANADTTKN